MAVTPIGTEAPLLAAAACRPTAVTPVWFMRQAGRYMAEYRAIRAHHTILEICARPDLAAEITLQPVRTLGVDAAILFADILLPLVPMGLALEFVSGEGPLIRNPVRRVEQVDALRGVIPETDLAPTLETIKLVRRDLPPEIPLIGFAGAPFTVATYAIEGGPSRHLLESKRMMYEAPGLWHRLLSKLTDMLADFLVAQVASGAQALQVFDSWAGQLSETDYREYVLPHSRKLFDRLADLGVPRIHFGVGTEHLLETMTEAGGEVLGLDWRTPLDRGWERIGHERAVQGNLDPVALFAPLPGLRTRVREILRRA
ncbi:MAG TPA: uroporphyrinogen decarboxylase, partial [Gemmatimonadales bacterium]|nr:uroporphyrinogen decarboxylase [Gemmatimonadales bacterium]